MPITIALTNGRSTLVDDDLFDRYPLLARYRWQVSNGYVCIAGHYLHVIVCQTPSGLVTHHINLDRMDNRAANLMFLTAFQHRQLHSLMRPPRSNTGYKGVWWIQSRQCYMSAVKRDGQVRWKSDYGDPLEAARAYNDMVQAVYPGFPVYTNPL